MAASATVGFRQAWNNRHSVIRRRSGLAKPLSEDRRNLPRDASQRRAAPAEARVERGDGFLGAKHFFDERALFEKAFAMRVARVPPIMDQPPAHPGDSPKAVPVFKARHVVVGGVWPPTADSAAWSDWSHMGVCPSVVRAVAL